MNEQPYVLRQVGSVTVAEFEPQSLSGSCDEVLETGLLAGINGGLIWHLWLDFDRVEYLAGSAVGVCLRLMRRLQEAGGSFVVCRVPPRIMEYFELIRIDVVFDLRRDVIRYPVPDDPYERAFLIDMQADAHDDAARLIYADWLDEHDNAPRAEFIRAQCRRAGLIDASSEHKTLRLREMELLAQHGATWLAPVAYLLRDYTFKRGFVEEATVSSRIVPDGLVTLLKRTPLTSLRVVACWRQTPDQFLPALVGLPELVQLRELRLAGHSLDDAALVCLAAAPYLTNLRVLDLADNPFGEPGLEAILASTPLASLHILRVPFRESLRASLRNDLYRRFGMGFVEK
jgi:uncharacterized protein (TIGR02996 family)